jgi:hypothetical protein
VKPDRVRIGNKSYDESSRKSVVSQYEEVMVVSEDEPPTKHAIRLNEALIAHANTYHKESKQEEFHVEGMNMVANNQGFGVTFERTLRMPDDNKLHQLPGSLGSFELYNVEAYADRLPANIRYAGGVFMPMWQREAMWLSFCLNASQRCAVRVFVGHINAVSGTRMDENPKTESGCRLQDYVVIPDQSWIDGICVAPGVVRQFVAMPRK